MTSPALRSLHLVLGERGKHFASLSASRRRGDGGNPENILPLLVGGQELAKAVANLAERAVQGVRTMQKTQNRL